MKRHVLFGLFWLVFAVAFRVAYGPGATDGAEVPQPDRPYHMTIVVDGSSTLDANHAVLNRHLATEEFRREHGAVFNGTVWFKAYRSTDPFVTGTMRKRMDGPLPWVIVQDRSGKVLYATCGDEIPKTDGGLFRAIGQTLGSGRRIVGRLFRWVRPGGKVCPGPNCPSPNPGPVTPPPDDQPPPEDVVVVPPAAEPERSPPVPGKNDPPLWIAGAIAALTALGTLGVKVKQAVS